MPHPNIIVIGGSTGALDVLRVLVAGLPGDFSAAILVTLHTAPQSPGVVDKILQRASSLSVAYATDHAPIRGGTILIAPPDRHLIVKRDHVRTTAGPRENRFRPAVDPLFRTAAIAHGERVIAVVLSGGQDDGASGLGVVKYHGGTAIVQDPQEALAAGMPQAAIQHVDVDFILGVGAMPELLRRLVDESLEGGPSVMDAPETRDIAEGGSDNIHHASSLGPPSPFTCPDCGGTLWESRDGQLSQFQCHVGHRYSGNALATAQSEALDHALWAGLRALEESAELRRRMARHARDRGMVAIAAEYDVQSNESEHRADVIRRILMPGERPEVDEAVPLGPEPTGRNRG